MDTYTNDTISVRIKFKKKLSKEEKDKIKNSFEEIGFPEYSKHINTNYEFVDWMEYTLLYIKNEKMLDSEKICLFLMEFAVDNEVITFKEQIWKKHGE